MKSTTSSNPKNKNKLLQRILKYAKPYKITVFLGLFSLFAATALELSLSVVIKNTIDSYLLKRYVQSDQAEIDNVIEDNDHIENIEELIIQIDDMYFLPESLSKLNREEDEKYIINQHRGLAIPNTITNGYETAIQVKDFKVLDENNRKLFQQENNQNLIQQSILFFMIFDRFPGIFFSADLFNYSTWPVSNEGYKKDVFNHALSQSSRFLQDTPIGQLVSTVSNDVETINELFTSVLTSLIKDFAIMGGVIAALFVVDSNLAQFVCLTLPTVAIVVLIFKNKARNAFRNVRKWVAEVNTFLQEHIGGMGLIQIFNREKSSSEDFDKKNTELRKAKLKEAYLFAIFRPVTDFLAAIAIGSVIFFGAQQYLAQFITLGVIIAFLNLVMKFFEPVQDIAEKYTLLQSAMAGGERVFKLLDSRDKISDYGTITSIPTGSDIRFNKIDFSYKEDSPVLKDFNLTIKGGSSIGLVGYTGSGKTTITKLLTRLWEPQNGTITIGDTDITQYPLQLLRSKIQPIQQDVLLFNGSIKDNLCMGLDFSDQAVELALKRAQAYNFVMAMEDGINSELKTRGSNISTGQRQLLAFARIALHDPEIVIFDEATAHIDSETEKLIQRAMDETLKNKTAIIIAHRLSTIKHTDKIIVMANGEIQETGGHEELLDAKGLYYDLYKLQFSET